MWVKKGIQPYVDTRSQHQRRINVFGWVDPVDGLHGMDKWVRGNTDGFLNILRQIAYKFKDKIVDIWVDRAKWHKGKRVEQFLMKYRYIQIHYLPAYHPKLNYQETLWRTMRYEETTNAFFETIKDLEDAIFKRSQRWKPKKIKSLCQLI